MLATFALACLASSAWSVRHPVDPPKVAQESEQRLAELQRLSLDVLIQRLRPSHPRHGGTDRWVEGELFRRIEDGLTLTDDQWRAALARSGALHTRDRWPAREPVAVCMEFPGWLDPGSIRAVPRVAGLTEVRAFRPGYAKCGNCATSAAARQSYQVLGALPTGPRVIEFDVSISREIRDGLLRLEPVWQGTMQLEVEIVESLDDVLPPVHGPALDEGVRDALRAFVSDPTEGDPSLATLDIECDELDLERYPALETTAITLEILVLRDGIAQQAGCVSLSRATDAFVSATVDAGLEQDAAAERKRWSLRVRGVGQDVLGNWDARTRWDGSFEIPLDEVLARTEAAAESR